MKRRELIRGLAGLGVLTLLHNIVAMGNLINKPLHFVGLGQGGTNAMEFIHEKEIKAKYSSITGSYVSHLKPEIKHLFYKTSLDQRVNGIYYKKQIAITAKMKSLFSKNDRYVILCGLGASVGTGLIFSLLEFLQTEKKNYLAICSLPSLIEGRSKRVYATQKINELEKWNNFLFFDQQLFAEEGKKPSIRKIFEKGNQQYFNLFKTCYPQFSNHQNFN
jgi:cell division GTPase FtsZ